MNNKLYLLVIGAALISKMGNSQTVEMGTNYPGSVTIPGNGPSIANIAPIPFKADNTAQNGNNPLTSINSNNASYTTVSMSLANQQFTGSFANIATGLVFGAQPTTATDLVTPATPTQRVDPLSIYNNLGYFDIQYGGPTNNMFTVSPSFASGTGIIANPSFPNPPEVNGAVSVFTAAQVLFNRNPVAAHNSSTRHYFGDLVINFNRFIQNPTLHIAGLGGSYRYNSVLNSANILDWRSTFFSTELEIPGVTISKLSGNTYFSVNGSFVVNTADRPNGASTSTLAAGTLFDEIGAASGSIRLTGNFKTITIKIYMRGSDFSDFSWSTLGTNVPGSNRNPFTGDIWWVSASASSDQLITLPSTGLTLTGALNNDNVSLNWKTNSEINTKNFEVERSTDGVSYSTIALKDAAGDSPVESRYSVVDPGMTAQVHYYRIKLNDLDGKVSYSNVVVIRKAGGAVKGVKTFPNPVRSSVNLEFSNMKGNYVVELFNNGGQLVHTEKSSINATVQYVVIQRNNMPAGTYTLRIRNIETGVISTEKIIMQ